MIHLTHLPFTANTGGTANLAMIVTGTYSNDKTKNLVSTEYTPSWALGSISPSTSAISIADLTGVLTIASSITPGDYTDPVVAKATSGDISTTATKNISVKAVANSNGESSGGGCSTGLGILALFTFVTFVTFGRSMMG